MFSPFLLHHLLAESAQRRPEAIALRWQDETMTYGELEVQSNRFAHALISLGVRPGDPVALHLEKSFASIIGVFGALKAGAYYVPVEPRSPGT